MVLHLQLEGFELLLFCPGVGSTDLLLDVVSEGSQFFDIKPLFLQQPAQKLLLFYNQQCKSLQLFQLVL